MFYTNKKDRTMIIQSNWSAIVTHAENFFGPNLTLP